MKLLRALREKPWLHQPAMAGVVVADDFVSRPQDASRTALWFLLSIISVLFFLFILTFLSRSQYPDFQALAGSPWQPLSDPSRLWLNTGILALASIAMQFSLFAVRQQQINRAVWAVSAAVFFTLGFLLAQLNLWQHLQSLGFYAAGNPANSYFYLLTAVHGMHVLGGLVVLAHVVFRLWRVGEPESLSRPLQLCATYWHFLFAIWLLLFALLTSRPETINALAALCGF